MTRWLGRGRRLLAVAVSVLLASVLAACSTMRPADAPDIDRPAGGSAARSGGVTLVAAGDVACGPDIEVTDQECRQEATADLVESLSPDAVLVLGDTAYEEVTVDSLKSYDASWGRFLDKTHAVVGNHEYYGEGPDAYWNYFGDRAGTHGEGWYSFDVGTWHVVVLNSECEQVGCDADSDQGQWLAADLAESSARCTLAAFHRPRFSSGDEWGDDESVSGFWQVLQDPGVDVVLNGHEHGYKASPPSATADGPPARRGWRS